MMKEEKELRKFIKETIAQQIEYPRISYRINALIKAVRKESEKAPEACPVCAIKNRLIEELSTQLGYAEREAKNLREQIEFFCPSKKEGRC